MTSADDNGSERTIDKAVIIFWLRHVLYAHSHDDSELLTLLSRQSDTFAHNTTPFGAASAAAKTRTKPHCSYIAGPFGLILCGLVPSFLFFYHQPRPQNLQNSFHLHKENLRNPTYTHLTDIHHAFQVQGRASLREAQG